MISLNDTPLTNMRRHFLRMAALTIVVAAGIFLVICLLLLLVTPDIFIMRYAGLVVVVGAGAALSMSLLRERPLGLAITPLVSSFLLTVVGAWLFIPDLGNIAVMILTIVVLLVSISGNRRITLFTATLCALLAILVLGLPQQSTLPTSALPMIEVVKTLSAGAIMLVIWLIADRYTNSHDMALDLIEQRAAEAEAARAEAEAARAESEARSADQLRLLELVQTLELPIIPISRDVLVAPLVGNLDSRRVEAIQRRLLETVAQQHAHTVVLDVTGISVIDTAVARALLNTAQAVRLLGAQTIISGISASIAQTLVSLGLGFDAIQTVRDLGQALELTHHHENPQIPLDR